MSAEATASVGVEGPVGRVVRLERQELVCLLDRLQVLVTLHEHGGVLIARCTVVWRKHQYALEQELGIVEYLKLDANLRQQPHRFDVVAVRLQKLAHELLRGVQLALKEQVGRVYDRGWQFRERRQVRRCVVGVDAPSARSVEVTQRAPSSRQRVIARSEEHT